MGERPDHRALVHRAGILVVTLAVASVALSGCGGRMDVLDPKGEGAQRIADLWWVLFGLGTAVFLAVMALVLVAIFRGRRQEGGNAAAGAPGGAGFVVAGGAVIPLLILVVVFGVTLWTMRALADLDEPGAMTVNVVGHQFWWEVRYPDHGIVTANEIHVPVGESVRFNLTGADVIHSLWVPELAGKMDLIPGKTNTLWIKAEEPGEYRGQCAELCGVQHANMGFLVIAEPADEFAAWLNQQQQAAAEPQGEIVQRGQEIFLSSACVYCHRVAGTNAQGEIGPDLTHLASRRTIAAGTLENNRGNLAGWIVDPQAIKPGNLMPGIDIEGEDLQALLTYLESLE